MIQNTSKVVFDVGKITDLTVCSNPVQIQLFQPLLQISVCRDINKVRINIVNDTEQIVYCLKIIDEKNNFKYFTKIFPDKDILTIEYMSVSNEKIFICYYEKNNLSYNKIYAYL